MSFLIIPAADLLVRRPLLILGKGTGCQSVLFPVKLLDVVVNFPPKLHFPPIIKFAIMFKVLVVLQQVYYQNVTVTSLSSHLVESSVKLVADVHCWVPNWVVKHLYPNDFCIRFWNCPWLHCPKLFLLCIELSFKLC